MRRVSEPREKRKSGTLAVPGIGGWIFGVYPSRIPISWIASSNTADACCTSSEDVRSALRRGCSSASTRENQSFRRSRARATSGRAERSKYLNVVSMDDLNVVSVRSLASKRRTDRWYSRPQAVSSKSARLRHRCRSAASSGGRDAAWPLQRPMRAPPPHVYMASCAARALPTGCPNRSNRPKLEPTRHHESCGKRAGVCASPRSVGVD